MCGLIKKCLCCCCGIPYGIFQWVYALFQLSFAIFVVLIFWAQHKLRGTPFDAKQEAAMIVFAVLNLLDVSLSFMAALDILRPSKQFTAFLLSFLCSIPAGAVTLYHVYKEGQSERAIKCHITNPTTYQKLQCQQTNAYEVIVFLWVCLDWFMRIQNLFAIHAESKKSVWERYLG